MDVAILSAGEGSRLGMNSRLPKSFAEINGRPVLEWQLSALSPLIGKNGVSSEINIVLGYGFEEDPHPVETIRERVDVPDEVSLNCIVLPYWDVTENAASALAALNSVNDDTLLLCGDVVFSTEVVRSFVDDFGKELSDNGMSSLAAIRGQQDEMTAVRWDEEHQVTDYGAIPGHQEAGMFILNREHFEQAGKLWLSGAREEWFPIVFEQVETQAVTVPRTERAEINTQEQLKTAEERFQ